MSIALKILHQIKCENNVTHQINSNNIYQKQKGMHFKIEKRKRNDL